MIISIFDDYTFMIDDGVITETVLSDSVDQKWTIHDIVATIVSIILLWNQLTECCHLR